jgi:hypothetical protein
MGQGGTGGPSISNSTTFHGIGIEIVGGTMISNPKSSVFPVISLVVIIIEVGNPIKSPLVIV